MPSLHLIALPFAHPDDISLRALRLLRTVPLIVAPAAQPALAALAAHHGLTLSALIAPDDDAAVGSALEAGDLAFVAADHLAGGAWPLVQAALAHGHKVEPIPGANLAIAALVLSALPPDAFILIRRLPQAEPAAPLAPYRDERATLVMTFDAALAEPTLAALRPAFGDRPACLIYRPGLDDGLSVRGPLAALAPAPGWSGEAALAIGGAPERSPITWDEAAVVAALRARLAEGEPLKAAAKALAGHTGWDRRAIYSLGVGLSER